MNYDIIIVGMGPVGATAANLAGQWGLRTLVVDKADSVFESPRAMGFDHEVMRTFDGIGLAEAIEEYVVPYRPSRYMTTGGEVIKRIDAAQPPFSLGWAPNYVFTQPPVERALRRNIERYGNVEVLLGCEVLSVDDSADGTSVRLRSSDGGDERTVSSRYVLACDGGTSAIRSGLGLRMEDLDFDEPWLVVDVLLKEGAGTTLPDTNIQFCETERPCTFVVGPGQHRRWEFMINEGETPADMATPDSIRRLISRWLADEDYDIWRASTYRFHALVLREWRVGNIFLLGDAAHMTPPFLAQGMCQGIRDASNLIWKLALRIAGEAGDQLLESYQLERLPHVRRTTEVAKEFGQVICERNPVRAGERDARMLEELRRNPAGIVRQALIPGLQGGFILGAAPAGELFPQPMMTNLEGVKLLLDKFVGASFSLVVDVTRLMINSDELLQRLSRAPIAIQLVCLTDKPVREGIDYEEADAILQSWFALRNCGAALVRPDHYVYGVAADFDGVIELLDDCFAALRA